MTLVANSRRRFEQALTPSRSCTRCKQTIACHRSRQTMGTRGRLSRATLPLVVTAIATIGASMTTRAASPETCKVANVVAKVLPSIVNITVLRVLNGDDHSAGNSSGETYAIFVGSGAIVDPSGVIVTNKHVIQGGARIWVTLSDKTRLQAQLIAAAALNDLALLKVSLPAPRPVLHFGDSDRLRVGQPVIAIGNPIGLGTSVSTGVVSALNRDLMRSYLDDYIQTDAPINPGNSGGPMLDCSGDIVGIDTALYSNNRVEGSIGLGFAMPSNDASFIYSKLINPTADLPNWIGLHLQDMSAPVSIVFRRPNVSGAIVTHVDPDSPASHTTLRASDIITSVDGKTMTDARAILRAISEKPAGVPISLSVWRSGHSADVTVQGVPWPHMRALRSDVLASAASVARLQQHSTGLHVTEVTEADRKRLGLTEQQGVLVDSVAAGSLADSMGIAAGDVIEQVSDRPAVSPADVTSELTHNETAPDDLVALLVHGRAGTRWVPLFVGQVDVAGLLTKLPQGDGAGLARDAAAPPK
jgi:serine protease Do